MFRFYKLFIYISITVTIFLFAFSYSQTKENIVLVADECCPYNCDANDSLPGYVIETAKEIFEPLGYRVIYKEVSWNRAIHGARTGEFNAIIGATKREAPDFIFPEKIIGVASQCFYTLQNSSWVFTDLNSLNDISLGAIESYSYGRLKELYIDPNKENPQKIQLITGDSPLERNIRKLILGRIDAIIEDENVIQFELNRINSEIKLKNAGLFQKEDIYLAFFSIGCKST